MPKIYTTITILLIALGFISCEENIFGPNKGEISGFVKDVNGNIINGALVKSEVVSLETNGISSAFTNSEGFYKLVDIPLGTVNLTVESSMGFRLVNFTLKLTQDINNLEANIQLVGSPVIINVLQNSTEASLSNEDAIQYKISVLDIYSSDEDEEDFSCSLIGTVFDNDGNIVKIYSLISDETNQSQLFEMDLLAIDFSLGSYRIEFVAFDNDQNISNRMSHPFSIVD